ncbi:UNVERIFIED_CONTAM: hypothetical protein Slati_4120500 [Sesamum latifolium]|uniref:Uncharacterized protein n=1 Tax=Sesamum latifolium TaxID=2727402 RepID=A0AAW2TBA0_9LAMI
MSSSLLAKQKVCATRLTAWNSAKGSHSIQRQIRLHEKTLTRLRRGPIFVESKVEENRLRAEIEQLLSKEEVYWKQRGKTHWLQEGDRNTVGQWLDREADICSHIEAYFGAIFSSRNPSEEELEKGTEAISARVTDQMQHELSMPFTAEEVSKALSQMAPLKSQGWTICLHYFSNLIGILLERMWCLVLFPCLMTWFCRET